MNAARNGLAALVFCVAGLVFNWPLAVLYLEAPLFDAYLGVFGCLAGLVLALALVSRGGDGPPPDSDSAPGAGG